MDILKLLQDYSINYALEGHKHCRPGWVNMPCPFCTGNPGYHLGISLQGITSVCWRCGKHKMIDTISALLTVNKNSAYKIIKEYGGISFYKGVNVNEKIGVANLIYPKGTVEIQNQHEVYLKKRKFIPSSIIKEWGILGTPPISSLLYDPNSKENINYKNRILIPIYWEGKLVTFQTRDITEKNPYRYLACPQSREIIHHKHILYRHRDYTQKIGICVEGVTDVWRLGKFSFATFGIKYTSKQLRMIAKSYKVVPVIFDDDPQAILAAEQLVEELKFRGVTSFRVPIKNDPGSMTQKEADYLVKRLLLAEEPLLQLYKESKSMTQNMTQKEINNRIKQILMKVGIFV